MKCVLVLMAGIMAALVAGVTLSHASERVLVEFKSVPTSAEIKQVAQVAGVDAVSLFDNYPNDYFRRLYWFDAKKGAALSSTTQALESLPTLKRIERSYPIELNSASDPAEGKQFVGEVSFKSQWGLENRGQIVVHDIDDVHSETLVGKPGADIGCSGIRDTLDPTMKRDVVVAVLDSGLDLDHPAIQKSIYRNWVECSPEGKLPFRPTEDRDGNGYIGDCMGWNFTSDKPDGDPRTYDDLGHGTHVAGIIAMDPQNPLGLRSVSSRIRVMPVKVVFQKNAGSSGATTLGSITDRVAKGILYAVKMKVDVINLSLGWPKSLNTEYLKQAVRVALDHQILVVAAAGNNNHDDPGFPCAISGVLCVGSMDVDGKISRFSNFGGQVDLLAPGGSILSLLPQKMTPQNTSVIGYEIKDGTSQAAPYVSAVAAILRGNFLEAPSNELIARMAASATALGLDVEKNTQNGLVQLERAMRAKPQIDLQPDFKAVPEVVYDHLSRRFSANLPVISRWLAPGLIQAELRLAPAATKAIELDQTVFTLAAQDSEKIIHFSGRVLDEAADSHITLNVRLTAIGPNGESFDRTYTGQFNVIRALLPVERQSLTFSVKGGDLGQVQEMQFHTVLDRFAKLESPEYYLTKRVVSPASTAPGVEVTLFRKIGPEFSAAQTQLFIPGGLEVIRLEKLDVNFDGRDDYFILSIAQLPEGKKFILFSFFSEDLKPLYGDASHWKFFPKVAQVDPNQITFMKRGGRGIPVFSTWGYLPDADQDPDYWQPRDTQKDTHVYYLTPLSAPDGVTLETRVFDDYRFRKKIKTRLSLPYGKGIHIVGVLPQTLPDWGAAAPQAVVSIGQDYLRQQYLFPVSQNDFYLKPLDTQGVDFSASNSHPYTLLDRSHTDTLLSPAGVDYVGFYSDHELIQSRLSGSKVINSSYIHEDRHDPLFGYIRGFQLSDGEQFRFLQSRYRLILWRGLADGSNRIYSRPILRYSFLTGAVFNDLFFPVISENSHHQPEPSIYVDATQIHGSQLSVLSLDGEELKSAILHSIMIPEHCKSLNPIRFGKNIFSFFSFICKETDGNIAFEFQPMSRN